MKVFGSTRSSVRRNHALIAPDSFVQAALPGWDKTQGVILISPQLGARFSQYLALMEAGGTAGPARPGVERVLYILDGEVTVTIGRGEEHLLKVGGFVYVPPDTALQLRARTAARFNCFEKPYEPLPSVPTKLPTPVVGHEQRVAGAPFLGDPDAVLQTLLPLDPVFDLAVNLFTYQPGATLPMVEIHVMEHGLLMLEGQGVYRLGESWYPVQKGDVIWMASYCPQWFVAMGKQPARYLYYKDVNRDPLGSGT
jgi:(S)-ureidoglycine aminohydrolase